MGAFDNWYSNNITSQQTPMNKGLSPSQFSALDAGGLELDPNTGEWVPSTVTPGATGGLTDWFNNNAKGIGVAAQVGGLALSGYDTLFGDTAKKNKKQMQLLDQQIANNADIVRRRKDLDTAWAKPGGGGLAATGIA